MDDILWKIVAGVAAFSTVALWRIYTTRVEALEKRVTFLYEEKWPQLEDRTTALEAHKSANETLYKKESEQAEKRFNKTMRILNALMWAVKQDNCSQLDPDSLFRD